MSIYAWCEDSGSGFEFWQLVFRTWHPEVAVETKMDNSRLRKAAGKITDDGNEYYILMDSFVDNADVLREIDGLKRCVSGKNNVHIVDVHSFEFALLSFEPLIQWVFAEQDELKDKRNELIRAREIFIEQMIHSTDAGKTQEFVSLFPYAESHNNEQTAAALLYEITRNTGFETDKGKLGACFAVSCCEEERQSDDLCGLDRDRLTADEKSRELVSRSILEDAFRKAGLANDNRV